MAMSIRARAARKLLVHACRTVPSAPSRKPAHAWTNSIGSPAPATSTTSTRSSAVCRRSLPHLLPSHPDRHLLYIHGGAYVLGSPRSHIAMVANLAKRASATATVIEYRLAPEHVYPAAIDDCVAAYRALITDVDPATITIAGDSAGGGAALSTLVALRDAGDPLPAAAYLLSPWTDLTGSGESVITRADADPMIDGAKIAEAGRVYAGDVALDDPGVSPLFADLTGLPPMLIQTGMDEVLLSDSTRLADRAARSRRRRDARPRRRHVARVPVVRPDDARGDRRARPRRGVHAITNPGEGGRMSTAPRFPELGFYTLAGGAQNPRDLITECARAEELGLGAVFISERFNVKEAVTLSGAAAVGVDQSQDHHRAQRTTTPAIRW